MSKFTIGHEIFVFFGTILHEISLVDVATYDLRSGPSPRVPFVWSPHDMQSEPLTPAGWGFAWKVPGQERSGSVGYVHTHSGFVFFQWLEEVIVGALAAQQLPESGQGVEVMMKG